MPTMKFVFLFVLCCVGTQQSESTIQKQSAQTEKVKIGDASSLIQLREKLLEAIDNPDSSTNDNDISDLRKQLHKARMDDWWNDTFPPTNVSDEHRGRFSDYGQDQNNTFAGPRKEYRTLSDLERVKFHQALQALREFETFKSHPKNEYDGLSVFHHHSHSPPAHGGPSFLPWHREYILRWERALQKYNPSISLPYWDSTLDSHLNYPRHSVMFTPEYAGSAISQVTTGPFANWTIPNPYCKEKFGAFLTRDMSGPGSVLFREEELQFVFNHSTFKELTNPNTSIVNETDKKELETFHNSIHDAVGGHMSDLTCAPYDLLFYMHHCFIDYVWEVFRKDFQETNPETEYPDDAVKQHGASDPMLPFENMFNRDGLRGVYTKKYYSYAQSPRSCQSDGDCAPSALWCDLSVPGGRCRAKAQLGGPCSGEAHNSCYGKCEKNGRKKPRCRKNVCKC